MNISFYSNKSKIYFPTKLGNAYWGDLNLSLSTKRSFFKEGIFFPTTKPKYYIFQGTTKPVYMTELGVLLTEDGLLHRVSASPVRAPYTYPIGDVRYDNTLDAESTTSPFLFLRKSYPRQPVLTLLDWLGKCYKHEVFDYIEIDAFELISLWKKCSTKLDSILTNMDK